MPCPASPPQLVFELPPRQSRAFNDMVAAAFAQPNTAGGVEVYTRSGNTATPDQTWSAWSKAYTQSNGERIAPAAFW